MSKPLSARAESVLLEIVRNQRRARGLPERPLTRAAAALPPVLSIDKVGYWNAFHVLVDRGYLSPRALPHSYGIRYLQNRGLL